MKNNEYTIMSFNLLFGATKSGSYPDEYARREAVITQIKETAPDTLGVQECNYEWYDILCEDLADEYDVVGELTNYEYLPWRNAVFYRKDRFELVKTQTYWLSDTPEVMSKTPFSKQFRTVTCATLKDKKTGKTVTHCNTHMGFLVDEKPIQYGALLKVLGNFAHPLLLTGDFNTKFETENWCSMIEESGYVSAFHLTDDHDEQSSYRGGVGHIDHCFCTDDTLDVISHRLLGDTVNGVAPSDHKALVVKYSIID